MEHKWFFICLGVVLYLVPCIFSDCIFPPNNLPHGRILFQSPKDSNETTAPNNYLLRFRCFSGYTRIGPSNIICIDGEWSDIVPTCTKMKCSEPPEVRHGSYELHAGVHSEPTLGSSVTYSCNVGYELVNISISTLHCSLDKGTNTVSWEGETPACKARESCKDPGVSKDGSRTGNCCFIGDVLEYSCEEEFELVGEKQIQCLSSGNWSSTRPLCKPSSDFCEHPPLISHGLAIGSKIGDYYIPYDEVEIICKPGYSYRGPTEYVMCEEEGSWDDDFGNCTVTYCDLPPPLANGTIPELLSTNETSFPFNFALTYKCEKGFRLVGGDSWRFCDKKGWSGKTPTCEPVLCPDPGSPEHGSREGSNFSVGSKVHFQCFSGYYLIGSFERFCMPNGQWTGELTRCDSDTNYCPDPGIPINGFKNSTSYDMGDKVGFQCRPGYIQVGSVLRECLHTRTWSGRETRCLGPYDFDNSVKIRDTLEVAMSKKVIEQQKQLEKYHKAEFELYHGLGHPLGRALNLNHPGRLILYFIFDVSGSVGPENFEKSINFAKAIVKKVGISENGARAGALTFSSEADVKFLPVDFKTTDDVLNALDEIRYTGGGTSASSALSSIRKDCIPLTQGVLGKIGQKSVIFILTDGRANMGGDPQQEANLLKEAKVEIYCIGITGDVKKDSLYKIASDSEKDPHVFILRDYATLAWLVQEITNGSVDYSKCGLGLETVGSEVSRGKIVGGQHAVEAWPWMAALYFVQHKSNDPTTAELQCGGSIINQRFILTAAHCMYTPTFELRYVNETIVKLGLTNVNNESFVMEPEVKRFYMHPRYQPSPSFYDYDIALLQLKAPIEYNAYVRPICLPPLDLAPDTPLYKPQEIGLATGWGHEGIVFANRNVRVKSTDNLKELKLPIQTRERCIQSLLANRGKESDFTERMFCAGTEQEGHDTCHGDSGGPLMQAQLNDDGYLYWTQVGIVSWGIGCGQPNTYGYYTHVQQLRPWVDRTIQDILSAEA